MYLVLVASLCIEILSSRQFALAASVWPKNMARQTLQGQRKEQQRSWTSLYWLKAFRKSPRSQSSWDWQALLPFSCHYDRTNLDDMRQCLGVFELICGDSRCALQCRSSPVPYVVTTNSCRHSPDACRLCFKCRHITGTGHPFVFSLLSKWRGVRWDLLSLRRNLFFKAHR